MLETTKRNRFSTCLRDTLCGSGGVRDENREKIDSEIERERHFCIFKSYTILIHIVRSICCARGKERERERFVGKT